jgi:hypothetical protein
MGIDNDTPTVHNNITFKPDGTKGSLISNPNFNNIYFSGNDAQVMLTLTHDGRMILGPGISKQKATQEIAAMLVREYHKLTGVDII